MTDGTAGGRTLWVTGAGSGIGRAVAVSAAEQGYRVVLSGRRVDALGETASLVEGKGGTSLVVPMDATEPEEVLSAHREITESLGRVTHLVLSAGLNVRERFWRDQSMTDFAAVVQTNLTAAVGVVSAVLPSMRAASDGTVVFVSSYAAWRFHPGSGIAYSATKTALSSLAQSLNAEEKRHGVRACHLCPSDTDTDFLAARPNAPGADARATMLTPADVASAIQFVLDAPSHVCIDEMVVTSTGRPR